MPAPREAGRGRAHAANEAWWSARSDEPCPTNSEEAVAIAEAGGLARTLEITVKPTPDLKFWEVVSYSLGEIPEGVEIGPVDDEIPF